MKLQPMFVEQLFRRMFEEHTLIALFSLLAKKPRLCNLWICSRPVPWCQVESICWEDKALLLTTSCLNPQPHCTVHIKSHLSRNKQSVLGVGFQTLYFFQLSPLKEASMGFFFLKEIFFLLMLFLTVVELQSFDFEKQLSIWVGWMAAQKAACREGKKVMHSVVENC